jgi:hypothetical protein
MKFYKCITEGISHFKSVELTLLKLMLGNNDIGETHNSDRKPFRILRWKNRFKEMYFSSETHRFYF